MPDNINQQVRPAPSPATPSRELSGNPWLLALLVLSSVAALLLPGIIIWNTPALKDAISLPFAGQSLIKHSGGAHGLLYLPLTAALISLMNTLLGISLYSREDYRVASHCLWGTTLLVQMAMWPLGLRISGAI